MILCEGFNRLVFKSSFKTYDNFFKLMAVKVEEEVMAAEVPEAAVMAVEVPEVAVMAAEVPEAAVMAAEAQEV